MSVESVESTDESVIPRSNARPKPLPLALSLYRTDLLFRGLVDVTLVGIIVLAFAYGGAIIASMSDGPKTASHASGVSKKLVSVASPRNEFRRKGQSLGSLKIVPGLATEISMVDLAKIQRSVIESAPREIAEALKAARGYQDLPNKDLSNQIKAFGAIKPFDEQDPIIAYAKASLHIHFGWAPQVHKAQKQLRIATQAAMPEAYTLSGLAAFRLVRMHDRREAHAVHLKTLDDAGNLVPASLEDLSAEAKRWFERGASLRQAGALRSLGYAELNGFVGKANVSAAAAHWRDAATQGDGASMFELGLLYLQGLGVAPDIEESISLMQRSADQGFEMGNLGVGIALLAKMPAGDVEAAKRAIAALEQSIATSKYRLTVMMSHSYLARYLMKAAPPSLRDPGKALEHHRLALNYGYTSAVIDIAEAYEFGLGVERDLVKAHKMLSLVGPKRRKKVEPTMTKLLEKMTPQQRAAALAAYRDLVANERAFGTFRPVRPAVNLKPPPRM